MGCDIHVHIEILLDDKKWYHWAAPNVARNYALFGKMAGVRGDAEPIAAPRGIPKDASELTLLEWTNSAYCHSPSWLAGKELEELAVWLGENTDAGPYVALEHTIFHTYLFGNLLAGPKVYKNDYPKRVRDVRLVFWFDN